MFKSKLFILFFTLFCLFGVIELFAQESTIQRVNGKDTLVAYTDVPGLAASEFYKIEVKSAATEGDWIECYSNITRSLWSSLPATAELTSGAKDNYYTYVKDWSHTYANIEMSKGGLVEVRITAKIGFKIRSAVYPNGFTKANAHPAQKASKPTVVDNIVYFTIDNPCQVTIDINGQMDEVNTGNGYSGPAIHTVSLFANPVIKKPSLTDPTVYVVEPGVKPPTDLGGKTTLYFKPGVHDIGRAFTIYANKNYYIPGDAIVYGTLYNSGSGANIRIFGYGTLSGDRIKHELNDPEYTSGAKSWKLIWSENCSNFRVEGISLMNCPTHTANFGVANGTSGKQTFVRWCKIISWRVNGDGIGTGDEISDCFFRTQDDCTYVKGDRLRNVYWTDVNGSVFSMAGMDWAGGKPILVDDCDIIYPRHCSTTWNGGKVFAKRGGQTGGSKITTAVNATFRNIRITDPYQTLETFYISSDDRQGTSGAYSGITFKNITSVKVPAVGDNRIIGRELGVWDNITFDNVVLGGKKILKTTDFAAMGPFVTNVKFISSTDIKPIAVGPTNDLIVYPNPTSEKLFINTKGKLFNKIELIDFAGKVVYQSNHLNSDESINLKGMSKGLYMLKVHFNDKTSASKIMVQ